MKTLTWMSGRGNKIELRASCSTIMEMKTSNMDGHIFEMGLEPHTKANLELWVDGKKVDSCWDTNFWKVIDSHQEGIKKVHGLGVVGMTAEQGKIVQQFLDEVIESGKAEEVKAYEIKEIESEKAAVKAEAEEIIRKAATYTEPLMTEAEYKKWAKNYNDLHNEGNDGYVPQLITVELLDWAKKTINK